MINQKIKTLFNKKKKILKQLRQINNELDLEIKSEYGFHYSETNDDRIIDTLDYGVASIHYNEFYVRMRFYKEDFDNNEKFRNIP